MHAFVSRFTLKGLTSGEESQQRPVGAEIAAPEALHEERAQHEHGTRTVIPVTERSTKKSPILMSATRLYGEFRNARSPISPMVIDGCRGRTNRSRYLSDRSGIVQPGPDAVVPAEEACDPRWANRSSDRVPTGQIHEQKLLRNAQRQGQGRSACRMVAAGWMGFRLIRSAPSPPDPISAADREETLEPGRPLGQRESGRPCAALVEDHEPVPEPDAGHSHGATGRSDRARKLRCALRPAVPVIQCEGTARDRLAWSSLHLVIVVMEEESSGSWLESSSIREPQI